MTAESASVTRARQDAAIARSRVKDTVAQIKHRIDPRTVASETADRTVARASGLYDDAKDRVLTTAQQHPALTGGVAVAVLGLLGAALWRKHGHGAASDNAEASSERIIHFDPEPSNTSEAI